MTRTNIAVFLNKSGLTTYNKLKLLDLNITLDEAQKNINRDYQRIMNTGRNTTAKRIRKNGLAGSNSENLARMQFECKLCNYIDTNIYEYIVGVNSNNIIAPRQVDIPIWVTSKLSKKLYKFAVEYNGDAYHEKVSDEKKEAVIQEIGWIYLSIWEFSSTKTQKEFGNVDYQIENICKQIKAYVQ
jgi:hypothetical protein